MLMRGHVFRLTADLERLRADSKTSERRLQQELARAETRARLAQADAERQKTAADKERRYSAAKDQVSHACSGMCKLCSSRCFLCWGMRGRLQMRLAVSVG